MENKEIETGDFVYIQVDKNEGYYGILKSIKKLNTTQTLYGVEISHYNTGCEVWEEDDKIKYGFLVKDGYESVRKNISKLNEEAEWSSHQSSSLKKMRTEMRNRSKSPAQV